MRCPPRHRAREERPVSPARGVYCYAQTATAARYGGGRDEFKFISLKSTLNRNRVTSADYRSRSGSSDGGGDIRIAARDHSTGQPRRPAPTRRTS